MVQNSGKTLRTETYQSVNAPEQVQVEEDSSACPRSIRTPRRQAVTAINDRWRIDDDVGEVADVLLKGPVPTRAGCSPIETCMGWCGYG